MQNLHRNKRSMTLNLKLPEAREVFARLVKTADVVVENYRPDVKYRLGIDYESLEKINPRIILASISGFGQDGPYRDRPGFDQIAQGMSGLMSVTGAPGQGPMRTGAAIADVAAGLFAALGIMTALLERETSGKGQWVQSLAAAGGHRAARLPGRALPDEGRSAAAGRQRPSDQHADLGLHDRRRLHQRRRLGRRHVEAAVRGDRPRGPARSTPEFKDNESAREEPRRAQRRC